MSENESNNAELVEEHCSELWNEIKDALVLDASDISDSFLGRLHSKGARLDAEVRYLADRSGAQLAMGAQLRLCSVMAAMGELERKKKRASRRRGTAPDEDSESDGHQLLTQFRKWLQCTEAELARITARIPRSQNNADSLRDLELEQAALQEQIETEGRARHQQLCSQQQKAATGKEGRLCETLEHRYLALWLASLESKELIGHFAARLRKQCPVGVPSADSDLEQGPDPKRRKTAEAKGEYNDFVALEEREVPSMKLPMTTTKLSVASSSDSSSSAHQAQLTDIGYSSGENNSVHEGTTTTKSINAEEEAPSSTAMLLPDNSADQQQFALNAELEKSFYRTVPLDEFGMTDLDTDEGGGGHCFPRGGYLAQRFMEEADKGTCTAGGPGLELTDSLIVHVDSSGTQLNDFDEVMDLLDGEQPELGAWKRRFLEKEFSEEEEEECESQTTTDDTGEGTRCKERKGRKRTQMMREQRCDRTGDLGSIGRKTRRKWAAVRKTRSSAENGEAAVRRHRWTAAHFSSDFEWDEEEYYGSGAVIRERPNREGREEEEVELPDLGADKQVVATRKKALCAFREGLRQAAAESGHVNVRLQELLALVDQSLGGVESAAFLLAELNGTFGALSRLCHSLEAKMSTDNDNKENNKSEGHLVQFQEGIHSELMLCHERMNALETTCNNLALLLGAHLSGGEECIGQATNSDQQQDYLTQFAAECNRIREDLARLKNRFGEKFVFCTIEVGPKKEQAKGHSVDFCTQTVPSPPLAQKQRASFWRSYLLLCVLGLIASLGMLFAQRGDDLDWRWQFGPQLHYENGPPPV